MKAAIHPQWYPEARVKCGSCGTTFTIGSTVPEIHIEVCSNCHPFFTGEAKFIDTKGRVDRFRELQEKKVSQVLSKKEKRKLKREKRIKEELERPESLKELRKVATSSGKG